MDVKVTAPGGVRQITLPTIKEPLSRFIAHEKTVTPVDLEDEGTTEADVMNWVFQDVAFWTKIPPDELREFNYQDVLKLKGWIDNNIRRYQPEEMETFKHNGHTYLLPDSPTIEGKKEYLRGMKWGEWTEYNQAKVIAQKIKQGDNALLPKLIAIACKREGEELPYEPLECDRFIESRTKEMESLPMDTALNCSFFLLKRSVTSIGSVL